MKSLDTSRYDLLAAYELILAPPNKPDPESMRRLQLPTLKTAFRKKALETHPDRSEATGKRASELNRQFIQINTAYQTLRTAIQKNQFPAAKQQDTFKDRHNISSCRPHAPKTGSELRYRGALPKRVLLTGQFLYYSGIISWQTLIRAVCWQRQQRPRIGEIARQWGILSTYDINNILIERAWERGYNYKFADYAMHKGYITPFEHMALLGKQHRLQRPIGEYFIGKKILSPQDLNHILHKLTLHNRNMTWTVRFGHKKRNDGKRRL